MPPRRVADTTAIRNEVMSSPNLFNARHHQDFETMARHVNEQFEGNMSSKDVQKMLIDEQLGPIGSLSS